MRIQLSEADCNKRSIRQGLVTNQTVCEPKRILVRPAFAEQHTNIIGLTHFSDCSMSIIVAMHITGSKIFGAARLWRSRFAKLSIYFRSVGFSHIQSDAMAFRAVPVRDKGYRAAGAIEVKRTKIFSAYVLSRRAAWRRISNNKPYA